MITVNKFEKKNLALELIGQFILIGFIQFFFFFVFFFFHDYVLLGRLIFHVISRFVFCGYVISLKDDCYRIHRRQHSSL